MSHPVDTISLGCRLNSYESDRMATLARQSATGPVVIINTCAVTGEAVRQSRQAIRRARKTNPDAAIIVSGCAVQLDPEAFAAMPEVSRVIGNADKLQPEAWGAPVPVGDVFAATTLSAGPEPLSTPQARAHLEVQNGCDHRCTFCIIPFGRGRSRSKPAPAIVDEALALIDRGAREIVLTGVDLTSYGPDLGEGVSLADPLLALIRALPPQIRVRLSSIDGAEVDDRLFELVTGTDQIMPYLHLSLQSGDTMILKRMKRRHTRDDAIDLCTRLRTARPEIAFGADIIAGFPTETDDMFESSLSLIDACDLSFVHVFPFSPRSGTPAARMPQLPRDVVKSRAAALRRKADSALTRHLRRHVGRAGIILIEQTNGPQSFGKLPDFTEVAIDGAYPAGALVPARLTSMTDRHLLATQDHEEATGQ